MVPSDHKMVSGKSLASPSRPKNAAVGLVDLTAGGAARDILHRVALDAPVHVVILREWKMQITSTMPLDSSPQATLRVFATQSEAEREIARAMIGSLQEFIEDRKDFDDATTLKEFAVDVDILPDGKLVTEDGCTFE